MFEVFAEELEAASGTITETTQEAAKNPTTIETVLNTIYNWLITNGLKILIAFVVLIISFKLITTIFNKLDKKLEKRGMDVTLRKALIPVIRFVCKALIIVILIGYLGFETSSISALIVSLGATIGLALQGSLGNLAGGIILLIMRPYKIGDFIEVNGNSGTVSEIKLFYTYLNTPDNKVVIIPNSTTSNASLINYSINDTRRDDIVFSISYEEDFEKAKKVILKVINDSSIILNNPEPFVNITSHSDNSIDILARFWTKSENFWDAHWYMMEAVKIAFDKNNISIPYPQLDVHLDKPVEK